MFKYFLFSLFLFSSLAHSAAGIVSGSVKHIRIHDKTAHSSHWAPPAFWFSLEGVNSAGQCKKYRDTVLFVMDTEQAYSMIMAAFMAGKEISVRYDEDVKADGSDYCRATYVTLGNPPPLY